MKKKLLLLVLFITAVDAQAQFTAGNLVVSKFNTSFGQTVITNADNTGNGYYGILQETTTAGVPVGSAIALPSLVFDGRITTHEGGLCLSKDGKYVTIVGFTAGVGGNSAAFRAAGKRIYRVGSAGTVDAGTNIQAADFTGAGYRSVISADGSSYLVAVGTATQEPGRTIAYGSTGLMTGWGPSGAGPLIRNYSYTGKGLYGCGSAGVFKFDESTGAATNIGTGDYTQVVVLDVDGNTATGDVDGNDVMYAAHRTAGVYKYSWSGGTWVVGTAQNGETIKDGISGNYTADEPGYGVYSITGSVIAGKPTLYCISPNGISTSVTYGSSHIIKIVDNTAANVDWTNLGTEKSILASTGNTEIFKVISFVPQGTLSNPSFEQATKRWTMYPNPSKGVLNINSEVSGSFNIYNVLGQKVHQFKVENGSNTISLDRLNGGTYFVEGAKASQKLIIQK